jgi:hypothetical protein
MSRAAGLARALRDLKIQRDEVLERKQSYDHDCNRAVRALAGFTAIVEKANAPDLRRSAPAEPPPPPPPPPPPQDEAVDGDDPHEDGAAAPPWAKKALRLIAMRTHPDRVALREDLDEWQRDRLTALYREANESYESGNYSALAEIAAELEIDAGIPEEELERGLEGRISTVREELAGAQKTLSWAWGTSFGDVPKKVRILRRCCEIMGIPTPDDSALAEIVRELESKPDFDIVDRLGRVRRIKSGVERRKSGERPVKRIR